MAMFKCKMCGGDLVLKPDNTVAECEYCGSMQTLPRVSDERLASFYERANDLRMSHEFDKAVEIYEKIIEENPTDSDAYWSMVLCKYGIEYVEETKGGPRKPTINRAQLVSVFEDANYRSAIKHADGAQRQLYEAEAARIDRILQRYLEISRNEPAYDVFICYKETDADGKRTIDSVRAGEIYRELTAEGFKVFFAPVTLENKLGEDYEPYIFAAIHSAKVMVVIGTKPEYFNAVWVKNEWSRFLTLSKSDTKKNLIPVYGSMDPYDMPEAFRFKQSQNMEKLGFMLDLVRGIEKIVGKNKNPVLDQAPAYQQAQAVPANVAPLLQRITMFLEDRDWDSADIYCEKVLDIEPTNALAHLYKLLVETKVTNEAGLKRFQVPLENMKAYKNAVRYADESLSSRLIGYNRDIEERLAREEADRLEAERIRIEQAQLAAQREKERSRREAEYREKKQTLSTAINNASSIAASKVQVKERLESQLAASQEKAANLQQYKRKIHIPALAIIINTILIYILIGNDAEVGVGMLFVALQFVLAILLASARGKSKLLAAFLVVPTLFIFPFCSALKGFIETARSSVKALQMEENSIKATIQIVENDLTASRKSLSELNRKMDELEKNREEEKA